MGYRGDIGLKYIFVHRNASKFVANIQSILLDPQYAQLNVRHSKMPSSTIWIYF